MKKAVSLVLVLALAFALVACTQAPEDEPLPDTDDTEPVAAQTIADMDDAERLAFVMPYVVAYNSCLLETFGAEISESETFGRAYASESDSYSEGPVAAVFSYNSGAPSGLWEDPTYAMLYLVTNYSSVSEISADLSKYLDPSLFTSTLSVDFVEYNGSLYMIRGSRGYGAETIDPASLAYVGSENGRHTFTVDGYYFDEYDTVVTIVLQDTEGDPIMVSATK